MNHKTFQLINWWYQCSDINIFSPFILQLPPKVMRSLNLSNLTFSHPFFHFLFIFQCYLAVPLKQTDGTMLTCQILLTLLFIWNHKIFFQE